MPHYQLEIYGKEDPEPDQYYIFQYAKNDVWNDTLLSWSFFNDFAANGKYLNALPVNVIDTDVEVFDVQVRALSVDQDYLLFIDQCIFNYMPNMFFSPPPATVTGNVSNGALGYFYAASVSVSRKIVVERKHYHTD